MRQGSQQSRERCESFPETPAAQFHCPLIIVRGDGFGHSLSLLHTLHQRHASDTISAKTNQLRFRFSSSLQNSIHGGAAHERTQVTVKGAGRAAALNVS